MKSKMRGLLAIGLLVGPVTAQATLLAYDNFGPADTFLLDAGWPIGGYDGVFTGVQFTAAITGAVSTVDLGGFFGNTVWSRVKFDLYTNSSTNLPGTLLETFNVVVNNEFETYVTSTGVLSGSTVLEANSTYWLVASVGEGVGTLYHWMRNSTEDLGRMFLTPSYPCHPCMYPSIGDHFTLGTLRVNVVTEPSTLVLLGLGLAGLGLSRRRKA